MLIRRSQFFEYLRKILHKYASEHLEAARFENEMRHFFPCYYVYYYHYFYYEYCYYILYRYCYHNCYYYSTTGTYILSVPLDSYYH